MRNLAEYPITRQEVLDALVWASKQAEQEAAERCGDIRSTAILVAIGIVTLTTIVDEWRRDAR